MPIKLCPACKDADTDTLITVRNLINLELERRSQDCMKEAALDKSGQNSPQQPQPAIPTLDYMLEHYSFFGLDGSEAATKMYEAIRLELAGVR